MHILQVVESEVERDREKIVNVYWLANI
jgi:hypothetical protein